MGLLQTLTFLMQALLLIENNELTVLVGLFQDVLALLDVAVVVLQSKEGGHQGHVSLKNIRAEEHITRYHSRTLKTFNTLTIRFMFHPKTTSV